MKMICRECRSDLYVKLNYENVYLVEPCEMCLEKLNAEIRYKDDLLQEKDEQSYDEGYQDGFSEGYNEGYDKGHEEGYDEGFLADHEE